MQSNEAILIRIRRALLKRQMTQRDLANALGKKEAEVSRWMSGRMGISETNLKRIEEVLGIALTQERMAQETRTLLRIGVIGTGSIANRFVKETPHVENAYLSAAYNTDPKATKSFCREYGIPVEAKSVEELLKASDAIYIASPCYTHYEYARQAIEHDNYWYQRMECVYGRFSIDYSPLKWLKFGVNYVPLYEPGKWKHYIEADVIGTLKSGDFKVSIRERYRYNITSNSHELRSRLKVAYHIPN